MALPKGIPALSEADFEQIESELDSSRPSDEQQDRVEEHLDILTDEAD